MNYKLLFIIIVVLLAGAISGYFVFKSNDIQHLEKSSIDISKSRKITNISLEDFYDIKRKINDMKDFTMFYFYSDCPHFTEDILIKDIKNNYYYVPEKNSVIIIYGKYEWTKYPSEDLHYHIYTKS